MYKDTIKRLRGILFSKQWASAMEAHCEIGKIPFNLVMVRDTGIEPVLLAWEASVLPLYESRKISTGSSISHQNFLRHGLKILEKSGEAAILPLNPDPDFVVDRGSSISLFIF